MTQNIATAPAAPASADYAFKAYNGHAVDCLCVRCCMADMSAHVKSMGWSEPAGEDAVTVERTCSDDSDRDTRGVARAPRVNLATEKQVTFILSLAARKAGNLSASITKEVAEAFTMRKASEVINALLACPDKPREVEVGMYSRDGEIYKVQLSRESRRLYAKRLTDDGFVYESGAIRSLTAGDRMSKEEAAAYGRRTGMCCVCGAELTNAESIEAGIGPICATKF